MVHAVVLIDKTNEDKSLKARMLVLTIKQT